MALVTWLVCSVAGVSCRPLVKRPQESVPPAEAPVLPPSGEASFNWPLEGGGKPRVASPFGPRRASSWGTVEPHHGVDLGARRGAPVRAAADGVVGYAGERSLFGLVVVVGHAGRWQTVYANLGDVRVAPGDTVRAGTLLGHVGDNCDGGEGSCLHFELRHRGQAVNPEQWVGN